MLCGESYPDQGFKYVLDTVDTIYSVKSGPGEIRRVNVNVAPLTPEEFRELKAHNIGTYQLFQETYHREIYAQVHPGGLKADFDWRISAMDRAMEAGIDDVGVGMLLGLAPWRYDVLGMLQHIAHLEQRFGVGCHTISVPRLEPAVGSEMASHPPNPVSDQDFLKVVAILRLAVPYTGIIMSTRETPQVRRDTLALGVSQISGGSRTSPGGYGEEEVQTQAEQFCLGDHRPLDEVIRDLAELGYIPSFCTACYRLGRTGQDFMDLAKPGEIKWHCDPNALSTFEEYLLDYASAATREAGERLIASTLSGMDPRARETSDQLLAEVKGGKRDKYC
jgi:2-iminoacetate synthase